jgi:hypothetical protein
MSGVIAHSEVLRTRIGTGRVPEGIIAAAREERAMRRLRRRIRWWSRVGLIR